MPLTPWEEREKGVFDFMQKIHADKANAYFLSRMGSGIPFQFYVNKPVKGLDDLKGMKLRCSPTLIPFLKKIGASPVMMPPGDIYTGMERGVVQGYVWPAAQIREWGWEKVTKYVLEPATPYQAIDVVLVNLDVWKKLPKQIQELLIESAKVEEHLTIERANKYIRARECGAARRWVSSSSTCPKPTPKNSQMRPSPLYGTSLSREIRKTGQNLGT